MKGISIERVKGGERMDDSKIVSYPEDPADYYEQTVLPILQTVLLQDQ